MVGDMSIDKMPELLTLSQVSKILNVHPNTLRNWDSNGQLKAIRVGAKKIRRYKREDILRMINEK